MAETKDTLETNPGAPAEDGAPSAPASPGEPPAAPATPRESEHGQPRDGERAPHGQPAHEAHAAHQGHTSHEAHEGHEGHDDGADQKAAQAQLEGDLDELVKTAAQRDEYLALAQRTQADFENYRKRVARDVAAARERGVGGLVKELLPALDNLDRALAAAAEDDPLLQGVRLVRSELSAALARAGVECFSPLGEQFDPAVHEAVATVDGAGEGKASGTVVEVYEAGYRLGPNIIRPARVVVAA